MGCFSFKCLECGRGIRSSSFSGEKTHLFLLKKGKVIQKMTGEYDSYGRVFKNGTQRKDVKHSLRESEQWKDPFPEKGPTEHDKYFIDRGDDHWIWHRVCDLMHDEKDISNGIAAIHTRCYKGKEPKIRSVSDPDQGWGPRKKIIKGYNPLKEHKIEQAKSALWKIKNDLDHATLMYEANSILNKKEFISIYKNDITRLKRQKAKFEKQLKKYEQA